MVQYYSERYKKGGDEMRLEEYYEKLSDEGKEELKELERLAAENDDMLIVAPDNLEGEKEQKFREELIERYLVKYPEMSEEEIVKKIDELIYALKNWETTYEITGKHYEWALTDPERLREDLTNQYKKEYPEMGEEEMTGIIKEEMEVLAEGAIRRMERKKKFARMMVS